MDVAQLSTALSQASFAGEVSVSVFRKSLDVQDQTGAALVRMMDQAAGVGQVLDQRA